MNISDYKLSLDDTPWRLTEPAGANKEWCVLWLQGFMSTIEGHREGVTRMAQATDTTFAMLDYAGHGVSPIPLGEATRMQQHEEVMAVYDELGKLGYKKIIAIGGSFGGYMAALLASKRELACLVLRAPANYPDDELETPYRDTAAGMKAEAHRIFRKSIDVHFWNSATEGVANHNGYTYVIEHAEDEVIDSSIPKSYFNAAKHGNYILIPGVKHSPKQMPNPEHYYQLIEMWIETIVKAIKHSTYDQ